MDGLPTFDCLARCKAPPSFYSGAPWFVRPEGRLLYINHGSSTSDSQIEWQIWTASANDEASVKPILEIDGEDSLSFSEEIFNLKYSLTEDDIGGKYRVVSLLLSYNEDPPKSRSWSISLKNSHGSSQVLTVKSRKNSIVSQWSSWSSCSVSCLDTESRSMMGRRTRKRACSIAINSEETCLKLTGIDDELQEESEPCGGEGKQTVICPVDFKWSQWQSWSSCSPDCGPTSRRTRSRSCIEPKGSGLLCPSLYDEEIQNCQKECPQHCKPNSWSVWSSCSNSCVSIGISSTRTRTRSFIQGNDLGQSCDIYPAEQMEHCNKPHCPIDGHWSVWTNWSSCSVTCGDGTQSRSRSCQGRRYGGRTCSGSSTDRKYCSSTFCPSE